MVKEIFVKNLETFENLECEYNLEDCGMSGMYHGWHWYNDDSANVSVYLKITE